MSERTGDTPRLRHIAYALADGGGFGDHYIRQDGSLPVAGQFDIRVYPRGDTMRLGGDPLRDTPHVTIRTWNGREWTEVSVTPIPAQNTP